MESTSGEFVVAWSSPLRANRHRGSTRCGSRGEGEAKVAASGVSCHRKPVKPGRQPVARVGVDRAARWSRCDGADAVVKPPVSPRELEVSPRELAVSPWELAVVQSEAGPSGGSSKGDLEWPYLEDPSKARFIL